MPIDGERVEVLRQLGCYMPTIRHRDRWKIETDADVRGRGIRRARGFEPRSRCRK